MEIGFEILYHPKVAAEDIPRIDSAWRKNIRAAIDQKLTKRPEIFGKPLRQSLVGHRALRVGDYRVVFRIENEVVKILLIAHRSEVYGRVSRRK